MHCIAFHLRLLTELCVYVEPFAFRDLMEMQVNPALQAYLEFLAMM